MDTTIFSIEETNGSDVITLRNGGQNEYVIMDIEDLTAQGAEDLNIQLRLRPPPPQPQAPDNNLDGTTLDITALDNA